MDPILEVDVRPHGPVSKRTIKYCSNPYNIIALSDYWNRVDSDISNYKEYSPFNSDQFTYLLRFCSWTKIGTTSQTPFLLPVDVIKMASLPHTTGETFHDAEVDIYPFADYFPSPHLLSIADSDERVSFIVVKNAAQVDVYDAGILPIVPGDLVDYHNLVLLWAYHATSWVLPPNIGKCSIVWPRLKIYTNDTFPTASGKVPSFGRAEPLYTLKDSGTYKVTFRDQEVNGLSFFPVPKRESTVSFAPFVVQTPLFQKPSEFVYPSSLTVIVEGPHGGIFQKVDTTTLPGSPNYKPSHRGRSSSLTVGGLPDFYAALTSLDEPPRARSLDRARTRDVKKSSRSASTKPSGESSSYSTSPSPAPSPLKRSPLVIPFLPISTRRGSAIIRSYQVKPVARRKSIMIMPLSTKVKKRK